MLSIDGPLGRLCGPMSRREMLRLGGLSAVGLSLPRLLAAESSKGKAKSCLLVFMEGGPSHIDLFDMKPSASAEVRGELKPIATTLSGAPIAELLPRLARQMHRISLVRSVTHTIVDHNASTYYSLTGRHPIEGGKLIIANSPKNFPPFGAVLAKLRPSGKALPDFVHIPEYQSNNNVNIAGQSAGFFGAAHDPFVAGDPSLPDYRIPGLAPAPDVPGDRMNGRRDLLGKLDRSLAQLGDAPGLDRADVFRRKAFALVSSPEARRAFDLSQEPVALRERYGVDRGSDRALEARKFGGLPHLGQCMLLARRLLEAGVRLVTLITGRRIDQAWDTHRDHFPLLKRSLCPPFDQAFPTLLEDMAERGMLDETLVVCMGEFGRTPKLGQITSGAGADRAGRDHWPNCYTAMFAGAGIRAGTVFGASDAHAAYPKTDPVTPADLAATIYAALGIDPHLEIRDPLDKPYALTTGRPIFGVMR